MRTKVNLRSGPQRLRCAIYTRKSSEDGLEQDFNSLDAQREACAAYIKSQANEGWVCLPTAYDDGGRSGATLERPALQALLNDIRAKQLDVVVVYKVDRLTRSLVDFAKIVECLDEHHVSFVSVTQAFNTTSSMGRLTLNVLLSFAQFEREVTAERIRDKIAASKQKGLWMGGNPPLGYDVKDRKLIINAPEAATARHLFRRYLALGTVHALKTELDATGIMSKRRTRPDGSSWGGTSLSRGALYKMLSNRLYRGQIVHKDHAYPGQHDAILDEALWTQVQARLAANRHDTAVKPKAHHASLLTGCLYDGQGRRLTPTHAVKQGRRYRYYVSQPLTAGVSTKTCTDGLRLPAAAVEKLVVQRIRQCLAEASTIYAVISPHLINPQAQQQALDQAKVLADTWTTLPSIRVRTLVRALVHQVIIRPEEVELQLRPRGFLEVLAVETPTPSAQPNEVPSGIPLILPVQLCHTRSGLRLIIRGNGQFDTPKPDTSIVQLLRKAHDYRVRLMQAEESTNVESLGQQVGVSGSYFTRVLRLAWLAPDLTQALLTGRHAPSLTAIKLLQESRLPFDWQAQREALDLFPTTRGS